MTRPLISSYTGMAQPHLRQCAAGPFPEVPGASSKRKQQGQVLVLICVQRVLAACAARWKPWRRQEWA